MTLSLYALAAVILGLALYVSRASAAVVNRRFSMFTLAIAGWVLGIAGVQTGIATEFWGRVTFASASMIPATFVLFSHVFPERSNWPPRRLLILITAGGLALAAASLGTPLVAHHISSSGNRIHRTTGPLYPLLAAYLILSSGTALAVFVRNWTNTRGLPRARLQHLVIGLLVFCAGALTTNLVVPLLSGDSSYSSLGPYFTLPLLLLVAHSIIRHRLMDLRLVVHRGLAHAVLIFIVLVTIISVKHFLQADLDFYPSPTDGVLAVFLTLLMLTAPMQQAINAVVDPYLYRGRVDHESALREAARLVARPMEQRTFTAELHALLAQTLVPETFSLALKRAEGLVEWLCCDLHPESKDAITAALARFNLAEQRADVTLVAPTAKAMDHVTRALLEAAGVEAFAVLRRHGAPLGFLLLGPRRSGDAYFTKDLAFLESLSELASIALENTLLYQQRIRMLEYSDRLLESLESAVIAVDVSGIVTSYNRAAAHLVGFLPSPRLSISDLPTEIGWPLALAATGASLPKNFEADLTHPQRGSIPVVLSCTALHDTDAVVIGALVVVTDLSTVKALERNQRRLEHLSMMAQFYAGIAHEIRNPLAAISNFVSMLPDRFGDAEYRDTATRLLPAEVARIAQLAERLRLMAPSAGGTLVPLQLEPLLADILKIHAGTIRDSQIALKLKCQSDLPWIDGDANQLVQLFVNLVKNAIEAMDRGTITLRATKPKLDSVTVEIIDEGFGIEPGIRHKVFEPFFTTKPAGSGLGLAICREIVNFHRATLTLAPRARRRGTVAAVTFPAPHRKPVAPRVLESKDVVAT